MTEFSPSSLHPAAHTPEIFLSSMGHVVQRFLQRSLLWIGIAMCVPIGLLFWQKSPGAVGLVWITAGTLAALLFWRGKATGLPLVPMFAVQHYFAYGIPIMSSNPIMLRMPSEDVAVAGREVCFFLVSLALSWSFFMGQIRLGSYRARAFKALDANRGGAIEKLGTFLVMVVTSYNVTDIMGLLDPIFSALPSGTMPVVAALTKAASIVGYFLLSIAVSSPGSKAHLRGTLWVTFAINLIILCTELLLSASINLVAAILIGHFWGAGRIPWKFIMIVAVFASFLHVGKSEMRGRYWGEDGINERTTLTDIPAFYTEWAELSLEGLSHPALGGRGEEMEDEASMLNRVDNLQNVLFAINAVDRRNIPTLDGATYALIPPLLVPRFFWPNKPRAHEGQIMLNVHFGRQSLQATYRTYIAWGLLAEAYGNFGRIFGAVSLGAALGLICAWLEKKSATKPLMSLEGLVAIMIFAGLTISFEMVASVLVTSLFQSIIITSAAFLPFVDHPRTILPYEPEEHIDEEAPSDAQNTTSEQEEQSPR